MSLAKEIGVPLAQRRRLYESFIEDDEEQAMDEDYEEEPERLWSSRDGNISGDITDPLSRLVVGCSAEGTR